MVALVPGENERQTVNGLLSSRSKSIGMREILYTVQVHQERDPGCRLKSPEFLRLYLDLADHALVMFDHEGSGRDHRLPPGDIQMELEQRLAATGWGDRAGVVVVVPELENWVWAYSTHVDEALGWKGRQPRLREWLAQEGWWPADEPKPQRPKEAALYEVRIPRSSAIYYQLAKRVGISRCRDGSFLRFNQLMKTWFPADTTP